jgi:uncharacterized protein
MNYKMWLDKGLTALKLNTKYMAWLKRKHPAKLDATMQTLHKQAFNAINCLQCANCCSTTSPIFYTKDIERAAKALKLKPVQFMQNYLRVDEDGDYVLQSSPCPFLAEDKYCSIYEHRPTACKEYPHTNRKNFLQISELTLKNTLVCPAVVKIVEDLQKVYEMPVTK